MIKVKYSHNSIESEIQTPIEDNKKKES